MAVQTLLEIGAIVGIPLAWILRRKDGKRFMFQVVVPGALVIAGMLTLLFMGHVTAAIFAGNIGMFVIIVGMALWVLYDSTRDSRLLFFRRSAARWRRLVRLLRA